MTRRAASLTRRRLSGAVGAVLLALLAACRNAPPPKQYELVGQILSIRPERSEVTIKHEDIQGFMPGMTMPFKVQDAALLTGRKEGDLVRATLVVEEVESYLTSLNVTGHRALETAAPVSDAPQVLTPGDAVADALFVDESGKPRPLSSFTGNRVALTFIYTRCPIPDFCPLMEKHFLAVQEGLKRDAALGDVRLVTVTMDPENDTPSVLKPHAQGLGADPARWSFLTGDPVEVQRFAAQFGLDYERDPQNQWQLTHNLRTAVIDAGGKVVSIIAGNRWTTAELIGDLKKTPAPTH